MKNQKGVSLIALIITIIVIIILAAIVMNASSDTVGNAQYARFAQEFGEFSDQVMLDAANVKSATGIRGQIINGPQQYYMTANGMSKLTSGDGAFGMQMPVGYVLDNSNATSTGGYTYTLQAILDIGKAGGTSDQDAAGSTRTSGDQDVAYVINDGKITNYTRYGENPAGGEASHEFYGDSNGKEYHFITSNGSVFTLPGYPVQQSDGSVEYHIDSKNGHYYVVQGNSGAGVGTANINNDIVVDTQPILAKYLTTTRGIDAITGEDATGINTNSITIATN